MTKDEILAELRDRGLTNDDIRKALGDSVKKESPGVIHRVMEGIKDDALVISGAEIGQQLGSIAGPTGRVTGAFVGGAIGEAATQAETGAERLLGVPQGETTFNRPDPTSVMGPIKDTVVAGLEQAGGQKVGEVATNAMQKMLAPFSSDVVPAAKKAATSFLEKVGGKTLPSQISESGTLKGAESIAKSGLVSSGIVDKFLKKQAGDVKALGSLVAENFADPLAESPEALGQLFINAVEGGREAHKIATASLFNKLDELVTSKTSFLMKGPKSEVPVEVGKSLVDLSPVKKAAEDQLAYYSRIGKFGKSEEIGNIFAKFGDLANKLNFMDAHALRSELLNESRSLIKLSDKPAKRVIKKLVGMVDDQMEIAAKDMGGDIYEFWRRANAFTKAGKEAFDNRLISKLISKNSDTPSKIGEELFKSGSYESVIAAQRAIHNAAEFSKTTGDAINEKATWETISRSYLENLVDDASGTGQLDAKVLFRKINDRKIKRTMSAAFSPEQYSAIKEFAQVADLSQKSEGRNMMIKMVQTGLVVTAVGATFRTGPSSVPAGAAVVFGLGPVGLAWALTSPYTTKLLTTGLKLPAASPLVAGLSSRIMTEVIKHAPPGSIYSMMPGSSTPGEDVASSGRAKMDLIDQLKQPTIGQGR